MFNLIKKKQMMSISYLMSGGHSFNTRLGKLIKITRDLKSRNKESAEDLKKSIEIS